MATKKVKKAAPARKKAVAKKAVAKKSAPARKKAVAKKAAPARKKAVAKKTVAKKAAPARKKAATARKKAAPARKKAAPARKKAAPARKKAVAKKAAPVRKKAVAKKAVAKKVAPSNVKKIEFKPSVSISSADKPWLQREQDLPVFLKDIKPEIKKEPISTQGYSKKKSRTPAFLVAISVLLLLGVAVFSASTQTGTNTKAETQKTNEVAPTDVTTEETPDSSTEEIAETTETPTEEVAAKPEPSKSSSADKSAKPTLSSYAPRNFASTAAEQEISFTWRAPSDSSSVIGYELSVKKSGTSDWVVISSVTPQQMVISVDLVSLDSTSQYRLGSILENGKLSFSKVILTHPGSVD